MKSSPLSQLRIAAMSRKAKQVHFPQNSGGRELKVSQFFGESVFDLKSTRYFDEKTSQEIQKVLDSKKPLDKILAKKIANVVLDWALEKGATHFCHWFQPLTGATAEKHDSFLSFDGNRPIEKLSASQLIQGEPDASSFPNGGTRSTFEARGYTTWDLSSPIFLKETEGSRTLCIPTAFISYLGNALDVKTPLLRSLSSLNTHTVELLNLLGFEDVKSVTANCGYEQEYFLVDKAFYFNREDLVMTGRTLLGSQTTKNQQLDDHYFGTIPSRVLGFMNDLEIQLYRLGIPAKTRHNEVAPGQFELAPIFKDANTSSDNNQLLMAVMKEIAEKHDFVCLFHEKPFAGINGSGKHLNWSVSDNLGRNLLEPGDTPQDNHRFLAVVAIVCEAVKRHSIALRAAIASHSNDHRLGANEAPPSIISVFLGQTVKTILDKLISGESYNETEGGMIETGTNELAGLLKDNTDRNRTSPFAFTGNKFEFRAVGSNAAIGYPLTILNAAISDVMKESVEFVKEQKENGISTPDIFNMLAKKWYNSSQSVVFNGDGYSEDWVDEAKKRGLPNLRTTVDAIDEFSKSENYKFLIDQGVYKQTEIESIQNVNLEQFIVKRDIEFRTQLKMINRHVLPALVKFKHELSHTAQNLKSLNLNVDLEMSQLAKLTSLSEALESGRNKLSKFEPQSFKSEHECARAIVDIYFAQSEDLIHIIGEIENMIPENLWPLPSFYDLLFVR